MKRYLLILKTFLKIKFIFKNPPKHELVIFDGDAIYDLKNFMYDYDFFILKTRIGSSSTLSPEADIDKVYFSFKLLRYFFKHYKGNIMTAYLVSLLEIISPKLVITFVDNSFKFSEIAKILEKKITFVAIQNAARHNILQFKHMFKKNLTKSDLTKNFYIPNFLCFGQFEIDHYKENEIKVKNFIKIGSLRYANFFHYIKKNKIKLKKFEYDICLISEPADGRDLSYGEKGIESGSAQTIKYTIQFCIKNNMKLIFACKRDKKDSFKIHKGEFNFYKKYLTSDEYNYLVANSFEQNIPGFSSYMATAQSKVVVGKCSTLLRENLAARGKILALNLTPTNIYDFPIEGICSIKNCDFQAFEQRLLEIHSMSEEDYFSKINKDKSYVAEYDEKDSTIEIIKRKIDYFLSNKSSTKN